ncbi:sarcosine oxidase subunit gamma [Bosea psychrotolerans]|uniref:N-methylglutamate dehydrogenase subunit D n=1 Tax=Bosea psychrotolerans TaxID=1871628 RepID=A0A2S4LY47_9HYPH|nr:sarcosine oxidase subunit gamma family protein [Bosea psychrotolerans]POR47371.1 N-methylglutamate dehydrogenase subunit D [Bosea psychrotolerans]
MSDAAMKPGWTPRSAWAGILSEGSFGAKGSAGVIVTAREGLGIASLIAPEDGEAALSQAVKTRLRLDLPTTPRIAVLAGRALVWAGPGLWLLVTEDRTGFADDLQALSGLAAIADQSDGRAVLTLSGGKIRAALAKGCMIDLHPSAFPVGSAALTSIAHIGVHLWRAEDGPNGAVFEFMVARSMAGSFWSWFSASAAEFGCQVTIPRACHVGRG